MDFETYVKPAYPIFFCREGCDCNDARYVEQCNEEGRSPAPDNENPGDWVYFTNRSWQPLPKPKDCACGFEVLDYSYEATNPRNPFRYKRKTLTVTHCSQPCIERLQGKREGYVRVFAQVKNTFRCAWAPKDDF